MGIVPVLCSIYPCCLAVLYIASVNPKPLVCPSPSSIFPLVIASLFSISVSLFHRNIYLYCLLDSLYYIVFVFVWLITLNIRYSRFIYIPANGNISSFFMAEYHSIVCVSHISLIQLSLTEIKIGVHISFQISVFIFSGFFFPSGEIVGSYGLKLTDQSFKETPYCFP